MLTSYKSQAGTGGCTTDPFSTSPSCYSSGGGHYSNTYFFYPTSGLNLYISAIGYGGEGAPYGWVLWTTTGQYSYYAWNPGSSHSQYWYDPYAIDGGLSLGAYTYYAVDYASASASW